MKLATFVRRAGVWDGPLDPTLDDPATLLLVFADSGLLDEHDPLADLAEAFPRSVMLGCSTAGEVRFDMGDLEGWNAPGDLSRMRISDADRHRVAEVLREAAGEGRLEFDELDERLELTFSATPPAELPRRAACASMRPLWVTSSVHWRACLRADII